jgi:YggT family protein
MLTSTIYPFVQQIVIFAVMALVAVMLLRLILNYTDLNPFGALGKFSSKLKRFSNRVVHPSAGFLARVGIDTRIAPLVTILVACVFGYFFLELLRNVLQTVDGIAQSAAAGDIVRVVGFLLYGFLGIYSLMIVMRIIFSWFMSIDNALMRFLARITDPILVPFRRMMPPVMMFDISPIIVLLILWFLQRAVAGVLLS